ncbi:superoxide dismutase family protein [Streptomyces sp. VRA16 Mangrove soil]|uniref:superoxide dismutase family protein n=1 Tax=Streptomyces sp. VRA16 Mangrove soil TaxID=2817434 RepID=UPI001A9EE236|nr:superoxide dismutase family protein [Streptomyces sp. VRA16 Mangrove soil]MBO1333096.1 superoxide dismutase family protein [Streptomyces sp. VRA16 Mangrove soil]
MVTGMVAGALAAAVFAVGGGGGGVDCYRVREEARFAPPTAFVPSPAITYDMELVPAAASITVEQRGDGTGMTVGLGVSGLVPGHAYGAHVHQKPCGADPADAGGHYQNVPDPGHVSAENEVWLDFTVDASGNGVAGVRKAWGLRPGEAGSVVLHDVPGGAGARVACFTVPFVGAEAS